MPSDRLHHKVAHEEAANPRFHRIAGFAICRWEIGATHQKALVNSPHLGLPGVSGCLGGWGGSRLPIRFRLRARFFDVRVRGSAPTTHRVLGGEAMTGFVRPWLS